MGPKRLWDAGAAETVANPAITVYSIVPTRITIKIAMVVKAWVTSNTSATNMKVELPFYPPDKPWPRIWSICSNMPASGTFPPYSYSWYLFFAIFHSNLFCLRDRSLSCEVHLGKEGVCYFGDEHRGHVLSHAFTLKDAQVRSSTDASKKISKIRASSHCRKFALLFWRCQMTDFFFPSLNLRETCSFLLSKQISYADNWIFCQLKNLFEDRSFADIEFNTKSYRYPVSWTISANQLTIWVREQAEQLQF